MSTSTSSAAPWSGSSRSSTACANGIAIQMTPRIVSAIETVTVSVGPEKRGGKRGRDRRGEHDHHLELAPYSAAATSAAAAA